MRVYALACAVMTAIPYASEAQHIPGFGGPIQDADLLYFAGSPKGAYELLERHLEARPTDYEALWRAARSGVVMGISEEGIYPQNRWLDPAILLGDRAVAERPEGTDGLYWRGAATGRRALNAGPSYSATLAQRTYDDAHAILALDSLHGGAHNLLGKLNYEVMSLSRISRFLARLFVRRQVLSGRSWEAAEFHLRTATEVWPDLVLFQFDLAQLYRKRGREEEACRALLRVTEIPRVHPPDRSFQEDAQRFLDEIGDC